jgi:hypothetical protein
MAPSLRASKRKQPFLMSPCSLYVLAAATVADEVDHKYWSLLPNSLRNELNNGRPLYLHLPRGWYYAPGTRTFITDSPWNHSAFDLDAHKRICDDWERRNSVDFHRVLAKLNLPNPRDDPERVYYNLKLINHRIHQLLCNDRTLFLTKNNLVQSSPGEVFCYKKCIYVKYLLINNITDQLTSLFKFTRLTLKKSEWRTPVKNRLFRR